MRDPDFELVKVSREGARSGSQSADGSVSVVVCTYSRDRIEMLRACVASIQAGAVRPDEMIVVVDRNPELAKELRTAYLAPGVRVLESDGSGLAAARNTGWLAATSDLIAFIDDDAVASPSWLDELLAIVAQTGAAVVGGRIDARWLAGRPTWYSEPLGWVVGCSYEGQPTALTDVRNVIGCNMLVRRHVLERLGGFDVNLGRSAGGLAGCEETELCIRARAAGARVLLTPGAGVTQVLPAERGRITYAIRRGWHEGRSKRALTNLHGSVLGPEASYSRLVAGRILVDLGQAIRHLDLATLYRAVALAAVAAATAVGYAFQAIAGSRAGRTPTLAPRTAEDSVR